MSAFLTGSRAYGTPREDSDIDLCLLMDEDEAEALIEFCGGWQEVSDSPYKGGMCLFMLTHTGKKLNIILFVDSNQHRAWKDATKELMARRPVTRKEAVAHIVAKENEYGVGSNIMEDRRNVPSNHGALADRTDRSAPVDPFM